MWELELGSILYTILFVVNQSGYRNQEQRKCSLFTNMNILTINVYKTEYLKVRDKIIEDLKDR